MNTANVWVGDFGTYVIPDELMDMAKAESEPDPFPGYFDMAIIKRDSPFLRWLAEQEKGAQ